MRSSPFAQGDVCRYLSMCLSCFPLSLVLFAFFECVRLTPLMTGETCCKSRRGKTSHRFVISQPVAKQATVTLHIAFDFLLLQPHVAEADA